MARIRTIKPEFWTSEQITECSPNARLLFIGLLNFCDDNGIHPASVKRLKMEAFPSDDFSIAEVTGMVDELLSVGLLEQYTVTVRGYWRVTGWHHQKIDQPTYKYPLPNGEIPKNVRRKDPEQDSPNGRRTFAPDSVNVHPGKGKEEEGKGEEGKVGASAPESDGEILISESDKRTARKAASSRTPSIGIHELVAEGADRQHAEDWMKVRKAPLTKTAWLAAKAEAAKLGITPAEAVKIAAENSWRGFKAEWAKNASRKPAEDADNGEPRWASLVEVTL
ncbi:hypothetical protein E4582_09865 [Luteimonas yindakuii]|uniref:Uncharacterized protein n=1 Tax=Luteimonas yindakuii TaxID=2565782 RepID=A0A4Z1R7V6_9GAMM|nr:hypothetical protein [Luteimonas yindakuii]TKS55036.1 hypothetical protein E4582_09865 [Luteimonas yindakuii]